MSSLDNPRAKEAHESAHEHPSTTQALHDLKEQIIHYGANEKLDELAKKILPKQETSVVHKETKEPLEKVQSISNKEALVSEKTSTIINKEQIIIQKNE